MPAKIIGHGKILGCQLPANRKIATSTASPQQRLTMAEKPPSQPLAEQHHQVSCWSDNNDW